MSGAWLGGLERARAQTLALVAHVDESDLETVHSPLMSPLVWDLGHIAAFEDLWLAHRDGGLPLLRGELLEVYDAFETPRSRRGELAYLRRQEAEAYLRAVRERVARLEPSAELIALVERHERQHAETMLQTLALARLAVPPPRADVPAAGDPPRGLELVPVAGGRFPLGARDTGFAYDNEKPQHEVEVESFLIGRAAVTNGEWLAFVADGGYAQRRWWSEAGWAWRESAGVERPLRWNADCTHEDRLGAGEVLLDPHAPLVHVSFHEAEAFAHARGLRLPSEAEWELAATWDEANARKLPWPWGAEPPDSTRANLLEAWRLHPVAPPAASAAPCGALGMIGDVWEWTSSTFGGYPGFAAHPYREYSEVFFGDEHRVLRGGSFATSAAVISPTFRNWDLPIRRQIFAGLRLAASA